MTNKLLAIINSLKVPKIKKILLYEMKFLVPNYSYLQNPWLGVYHPQIPVLSVLYPQLNLLNPPARTKFLGMPLGCEAGHTPPSSAKVSINGTIILLPPYAFTARTVITLITYYEQLLMYCSAVHLFSECILCYLLHFVCCAAWRGHLVSNNRHHMCLRRVLRNTRAVFFSTSDGL